MFKNMKSGMKLILARAEGSGPEVAASTSGDAGAPGAVNT